MIPNVEKIVTQHPGGYGDILAALESHASQSITHTTVRRTRDPNDPQKYIDEPVTHETRCSDILKEIEKELAAANKSSTGEIASEINRVLSRHGLPTPGDPRWKQPAEKWIK